MRELHYEISDFWFKVLYPERQKTVFLISDKDEDWWENTLEPILGHYFYPDVFSIKARANRVSGYAPQASDGTTLVVEIIGHEIDPADPTAAWFARRHVTHEGTHWFQNAALLLPGSDDCKIETIVETCRDRQMPCWFHEGHAVLYEIALASNYDEELEETTKELEETTRVQILNSFNANAPKSLIDPASFDARDWLNLLRYGRTTRCIGATGVRLSYSFGLATMEIMHHDFGEAKINQWISSIVSHPTSRLCPAWIPAFEETFGETVEDWYFRSAIPYLIEVFSEDGKGEIHIDEESHPPTYYCSPEISDPSVDSPTVQGVPTGPEPMIYCSEMASILEAQIWFDTYFDDYGDLGSLDSDMDGNACTREDTGGAVICSDGTVELPRACPQVNSSAQD